jgi:cephalosporin hydroxylase
MFDREAFEIEKGLEIDRIRSDKNLISDGIRFVESSDRYKYGYFWTWMDLPIIQMPEDIVLTQELLWELKPDFVVELGVAWGGSLAMYAAHMELYKHGHVFGIDITIPSHNREAIMSCPVSSRITLIEGSSTSEDIFEEVNRQIPEGSRVLLVLDSNHTHEHVSEELKMWSPIVQRGSYIIVSDTIVESIAVQEHRPRPWGPGNNPGTAAKAFLSENKRFSDSNKYSKRAIVSFNPAGYLEAIN